MDWHINSYQYFGDIRFGMSSSDIENIIGKPKLKKHFREADLKKSEATSFRV